MIDKDFNKPIGVFTQSSFIPGTNQAITGNTEGSAVVWEDATTSEGEQQLLSGRCECEVGQVENSSEFM